MRSFPNQFVNTRLLVDTKKDVVIIPVAAIQYGTQGTVCLRRGRRRSEEHHGEHEKRRRRDDRRRQGRNPKRRGRGRRRGHRRRRQTVRTAARSLFRTGDDSKKHKRRDRGRQLPAARFGKGIHESFPDVYPAPRCDDAPDGRHFAGRLGGAITQLPISALPEVDYPTMQIVTFYPGASPEVMASSVTAPLERQFGQVPGLQQMTSTSSDGSSVITLQFNLSLNIDVAEQEVQQAINASGTYLPADLPNPPIYSKTNPADAPIITLGAHFETPAAFQDRGSGRHAAGAKNLPAFRRRPGQHRRRPKTGRAHPGQPDRPFLLRHQPGGSPHRDRRGQRQPGQGQFQRPAADLPDRGQRPASHQQRLRQLVVAYRNNAPVRLSDVANVIDDTENNRQAAWMNDTTRRPSSSTSSGNPAPTSSPWSTASRSCCRS